MSSKKIVLKSTDGESFEMDEKVARKFQTISDMIDDDCADEPIPLQNSICTKDILALVIEYSKNICDQDDKVAFDSTEGEVHDHVEKAKEVDEKGKGKEVAEDLDNEEKGKDKEGIWDATDFMNKLDFATIFKVIVAANYLNFQSLLDLSCQTVADQIKDLQPEEIREIFNIENDFTPQEEEELRKENAWAFQDIKPKTATDDSETSEEGGSVITKEDGSKTTEEDGSGTTQEADSKSTAEYCPVSPKKADSKTIEEGSSDTTKEADSKTIEEGGSDTTKGDDSETTEEDGSGTTQEVDSKSTAEYCPDTPKEADSKTIEEGSSDTTKVADSETTEEGGSDATKGDDSKITEEVSKAQEE